MSAQRDRVLRQPPTGVPSDVANGPPGPAAVTQCAGCGAVADVAGLAGWVVARPAGGRTRPYRFGARPACVATRYTFPVTQATEHLADGSRGSAGPPSARKFGIPHLLGLESPEAVREAG
jgi:hypothetical protein